MTTNKSRLLLTAAIVFAGLTMSACATEDYVDQHDAALKAELSGRIDQVNSQVEALNGQVANANSTAQAANAKAEEAASQAKGNFDHHVLFSDDSILFDTNKWALSQENQSKLAAFAEKIKNDNQNVYIEIQGHGDSRGSKAHNAMLGEKRADAVRRYLMDQGIPLYHMTTISFGEERPTSTNATAQGQQENRRAVLVVEN